MTFNYPRSGQGNPAEYVISGLPWVTGSLAVASGSVTVVNFPHVIQEFEVRPASGACFVGFTSLGVNGTNRITATSTVPFKAHSRCTVIYLKASGSNVLVDVFASLTTVLARDFPILTGSGVYPHGGSTTYTYGLEGTIVSGSGLG